MKEDDINDIFKDFEYTVEGKKEHPIKTGTDEDLKERQKKAEKALNEEKIEDAPRKREEPAKGLSSVERVAYIGVIIILVGFITIDLSFFHFGGNSEVEDRVITAAVVKVENKTNESVGSVEETVEEVEKKKLSGRIGFVIDKIYTDVSDKDSDLGYINKIVFTIENGKDKVLMPVIDVFAYDSELDESWEIRSRGQYKGIAIESGEKQTGSVSVSPKSFRNLDLEKNIRLTLNGTTVGFITAINTKVVIS